MSDMPEIGPDALFIEYESSDEFGKAYIFTEGPRPYHCSDYTYWMQKYVHNRLLEKAEQRIAELEAKNKRLVELVKDASGALRVNGLGSVAQKIEAALESNDE